MRFIRTILTEYIGMIGMYKLTVQFEVNRRLTNEEFEMIQEQFEILSKHFLEQKDLGMKEVD